jgi:hypothetical protein
LITRVAVAGSSVFSGGPSLNTGNGNCVSGTYSDNNGNQTAPSISCSFKDANNRIDETYFDTRGERICNPKCRSKTPSDPSLASGDGIYGGSYDNSSGSSFKYFNVGDELYLTCKNNFGSAIVGGSISNPFSGCGRSSASDRSQNGPYVTCTENGDLNSWSSVYNDCSACRGCDGASPLNIVSHNRANRFSATASCVGDSGGSSDNHCYFLRSSDNDPNACYSKSGYSDVNPPPSIPSMVNGKIIYFCNRVGDSADSTGAFGLRCLDGKLDVKVACDDGQSYCTNDGKYTSTWSKVEDIFPDPNIYNWMTSTKF